MNFEHNFSILQEFANDNINKMEQTNIIARGGIVPDIQKIQNF